MTSRTAGPPGTGRARGILAALFGDRLISQNLVLTLGTVLAGVLGFAFHAVVSHRLDPAEYASAATVVSLLGLVGAALGGTGAIAARSLGARLAAGGPVGALADIKGGHRLLLGLGAVLAVLAAVTAPWSGALLRVSPLLVIIVAASVPFALATPFLSGALLGGQRFGDLAGLFVLAASTKLVLSAVLGTLGGAVGVVAGVTLGTIATYAFLLARLWSLLGPTSESPAWREMGSYCLVVVPGGALAALLLATDVLMVKSLFPAAAAGTYALVAVLGRAIFWGSSSVAAVLFPKVVFRDVQGRSSLGLMSGSLLITMAGGVLLVGVLVTWGGLIVRTFAGSAYTSAANLLAPYAVGMSLLGMATVLASAHQARGRRAYLWILLIVVIGEPAAIALAHASLQQVVAVVDGAMAVLMLGLGALYLVDERGRRPRAA